MDKAMRTRVDVEREKLTDLYANAPDNVFIRQGLAMIAHGATPEDAWRGVAVGLALELEAMQKLAIRRLQVEMPPIVLAQSKVEP